MTTCACCSQINSDSLERDLLNTIEKFLVSERKEKEDTLFVIWGASRPFDIEKTTNHDGGFVYSTNHFKKRDSSFSLDSTRLIKIKSSLRMIIDMTFTLTLYFR